jgi:hypothetical protein
LVFTLQLLYLLISSFLFGFFFPTLPNFRENSTHLREAYYYYFCTALPFQSQTLPPSRQIRESNRTHTHTHMHKGSTSINGILTYAIYWCSFSVPCSHYAPYRKVTIGWLRCRSLTINTFFIMTKRLNKKWTDFCISYVVKFCSRGIKISE